MLSVALNLGFVLVETGVGFGTGSLGLLSDAGHNLSDVFSLLLAFVAIRHLWLSQEFRPHFPAERHHPPGRRGRHPD